MMARIPTIRFVLDVHLAKLARHLRMTGIDVLWKDDYQDDELLEVVREEGRVLLTRDRALHDRAPEALRYYVNATGGDEQFREVIERFELREYAASLRGFLTRCLQCNSMLLPVKRHQVEERLPAHVRHAHEQFWLCPRCERVYWNGTHVDRMKAWLKSVSSSSSS